MLLQSLLDPLELSVVFLAADFAQVGGAQNDDMPSLEARNHDGWGHGVQRRMELRQAFENDARLSWFPIRN